jgi:chromatin segregation and condensation protein Rec8/ScpA/Scc1 (kleisin family)
MEDYREDYRAEMLAQQSWEETIEFLSSDMDPKDLDICVLADRYRDYIRELQKNNLQISARAIRVLSALLNMKAQALYLEEEEQESEEENPMDFEDEELIEEEMIEEEDEPDLEVGPDLEMPVKKKPKRRVQLDELKDSLRDAMEVKERREERQEQREQIDEQFEVEEEDIRSKLNSLYNRITNFVSAPSEKVEFTNLIEEDSREERIEKFKHVLNLENERRVDLIQEEFLGNLQIKPNEEEVPN